MILLIDINSVGFFEYYTAEGEFLVFIHTLHTVYQPYIKRAHNVINALLLCNPALINCLSLFNFYRSNNPKIPNSTIITSATVQLVLIYLPVLVMTARILFRFCKYIYRYVFRISTKTNFVTKRARKLKDLVYITHDRLMDGDVEFRSTCEYVAEHGQDSPGNT